jgi:hypothetical protein
MLDNPTRDSVNALRKQLLARLEALAADLSRQVQAREVRENFPERDLPMRATLANINDRAKVLKAYEQDIAALEQAPAQTSSDQPSGKETEPGTSPTASTTENTLPAPEPKAVEKPASAPLSEAERRHLITDVMWWIDRFREYNVVTDIRINEYDFRVLENMPDGDLETLAEALSKEGQAKAPRASDSRIKRLLGLSRQCSDMKDVPAEYVGLTFSHIKGMLASEVEQGITALVPFVRKKESAGQDPVRPQPPKGNGMAENKPSGQAGKPADRPRKFVAGGQTGAGGGSPPLTPGAGDLSLAATGQQTTEQEARAGQAATANAPRRAQEDLRQAKTDLKEAEDAEKAVAKRLTDLENKCKKSKTLNWWLGIGLALAVLAFVLVLVIADRAISRARSKQKVPTATPATVSEKAESGTSTKFRVVPRLPEK